MHMGEASLSLCCLMELRFVLILFSVENELSPVQLDIIMQRKTVIVVIVLVLITIFEFHLAESGSW